MSQPTTTTEEKKPVNVKANEEAAIALDEAARTALAAAKDEIASAEKALAVRPSTVTEPTTFEQAWKFAEIVARSKMFGVKSPDDAFVRMSTGMQLGLSAVQSLNLIDAIPGKDGSTRPSLRAKLKVALCMRHPDVEYIRCVESTNERATYEMKRRGREPRRLTWTIEDANRAKLSGKDNWQNYPAAMLRARASSDLVEIEAPDISNGLSTTEEVLDHVAIAQATTVTDWEVTAPTKHADDLGKAIDGAADKAALDAAWSGVKAAVARGDVTPEQHEALKAKANAKKDAWKKAAPAPAEPTAPNGAAT